MAMGIVSDSDFQKELENTNPESREESNSIPTPTSKINETNEKGEIVDVTRGRPRGSVEVPNGIRRLIADESTINGRQSAIELASQLGISSSSVSAYAKGATSTSSYDNQPNKDIIDSARLRVAKRARNKLMMALRHITEDKLENAKARDLAGIAKDMSAVVRNMEPDESNAKGNNTNNGPTFVFYSPQFRKEEAFDVVHAKD